MDWGRDWNLAIKRNSEALRAIIAALSALLGLEGEGPAGRIPPPVYYAVLRILRPAESALRRLIVIAARGLVVKLSPSRPMPKGTVIGKGGGSRLPAFRLYDTRKYLPELSQRRVKHAKTPPRSPFPGDGSPAVSLRPASPPVAAPAPPPGGLVKGERLCRRLLALKLALEDLPGQARRMARWRARREAMKSPRFKSPLRPGPPPGRRKRHIHPIDDVLADCHALAWEAMKPDTS